ncbi:helix-turn-helix transcriptional regulator [Sporosarcina sp. resist]|uniref:helix-turn-helix domain-containing protein n=1 Tax=Sporosarcina sp. resist TaxID=2762563 RepID=UPI00164D255F|nr:helix-turn-helix transcriptional regulator [Sporosarcina sp. resist]QNK89058.1 helix-turn-helix transcriptional regulator [Sporosarcina sp. resist]
MNDENRRFKELRGILQLNQEAFGDAMGLSKSGISNIENGIRKVTDQHVKLICGEFNVNEEWLRCGEGEMFVQPATFSLDEYAKKNSLSALETEIIKGYMELDSDTRKNLMTHFKAKFSNHSETVATVEDNINTEVEKYRRELEDEQKGETLLALGEHRWKSS